MRFKSLLTLVYAPDSNAFLDEPFNYEWGLVRFATKAVEHKYQQYIEFA